MPSSMLGTALGNPQFAVSDDWVSDDWQPGAYLVVTVDGLLRDHVDRRSS
jgi:hypothetical protein